jgi:hypothetical protein
MFASNKGVKRGQYGLSLASLPFLNFSNSEPTDEYRPTPMGNRN